MIWTFIAKLEKQGHRLFRDSEGRVAIADNSGSRPDTTDDGVLYLDLDRMRAEGLVMDMRGTSHPSFSIPLRRPDGSAIWTGTGLTGAKKLAELYSGVTLHIVDRYGTTARIAA